MIDPNPNLGGKGWGFNAALVPGDGGWMAPKAFGGKGCGLRAAFPAAEGLLWIGAEKGFGGRGWGFSAAFSDADGPLCMGAEKALSGSFSESMVFFLFGAIFIADPGARRSRRSVKGAMVGIIGPVHVLVNTVVEHVRTSHPAVSCGVDGNWTTNW